MIFEILMTSISTIMVIIEIIIQIEIIIDDNGYYYWIDTQADLQADRALQSLQLQTPSVAKRIIVL